MREVLGSILPVLSVLAVLIGAVLGGAPAARANDELDFGLAQNTLARILIEGNATFPDDELKSVLQIREPSWLHPFSTPRYRPDLLDTQLRLLVRYYRQRGFHQAAVRLDAITADPQGRGDILSLVVEEGPRTYLEEVRFRTPGPLTEEELRRDLEFREGAPSPADLNDFGRDIYALRTRYWDLGHLDVLIEPVLATAPTDDPVRFRATLEYRITPGRPYTVRRIRIEGLRRTRAELIARELRVKEGGPFSWSAIERSRRLLLDTALLRDVSFSPAAIDSVAGEADLLVQVVERKPAYYELGAGVGSRERVRLLGAWGHNNLFGNGRRLYLRGKVYWNVEEIVGSADPRSDPEINYRTDILYVNPHLRGSRFLLDANVYLERETRGESGLNLQTLGFSVGTRFRGGAKVLNQLALKLEETDPQPHPDAAVVDSLFDAFNVLKSQTRSLVYTFFEEERDNLFRPTRGSLASAQLTLAGGAILQGDNSFVRLEGAWHGYARFPLGGVLAFRTRFGLVRPYGDSFRERGNDGVPYSYRFFAGGGSSVRGYRESSLGPQITNAAVRDSLRLASDVPLPDDPARGGNYLLLTSVEWRFPLPLLSRWNLQSVLFLDGGNVWARARDIRLRAFRFRSYPRDPGDALATRVWDYRYSVGTGLRLSTPFGPVRVDVGWPLKRAAEEDAVVYHFSLGYPF